ncbi:MAG TPA: nitroreductase/quinone reductase family protein [Pseudonocardia sp.]
MGEQEDARAQAAQFWKHHKEVWDASGGTEMNEVLGMGVLQLNTTGRRSGSSRSVLLTYLNDENGWLVAASNLGADHDPGWLRNLRASDGQGSVTIGSDTTPVKAQELVDVERDRAYQRFVSTYEGYANYEKWTDREIPVVALRPERG